MLFKDTQLVSARHGQGWDNPGCTPVMALGIERRKGPEFFSWWWESQEVVAWDLQVS